MKVLILVLMEDALAQLQSGSVSPLKVVLILVLMEDALAHLITFLNKKAMKSLNPCFNGRCTRTIL